MIIPFLLLLDRFSYIGDMNKKMIYYQHISFFLCIIINLVIKILIIKEIGKDSTNKHNCSKHEKGGKKEQKNIMKNNKERLQKYVRNQFRKYVKRIQAKTETI